MIDCGPYVCHFPSQFDYNPGDRWTCPRCGTTYRLTRPKPERWWRNWFAPNGMWILPWRERLRLR